MGRTAWRWSILRRVRGVEGKASMVLGQRAPSENAERFLESLFLCEPLRAGPMEQDRKEKDGRAARGARPKKPWQEVKDARGVVVAYKKHWTNPVTKKRRPIRAKTPEALM